MGRFGPLLIRDGSIFCKFSEGKEKLINCRTGGMARDGWPYFDPEYETLSIRINPPRVSVDNSGCQECTLVKVDSINRPGILLEVVEILSDLDLIITKAYISSDGGWFMDVFHVTDQQGNKITDMNTIKFIEKALGPEGQSGNVWKNWPGRRVGVHSVGEHTVIELSGRDRLGLLSEVSAVLANLHFNVAAAEVWTHNRRVACVLHVNDDATGHSIDDPSRLSTLEDQLNIILHACKDGEKAAQTSFSGGLTHVDRRLHQMLFAHRDYEEGYFPLETASSSPFKSKVTIDPCLEKGYSVVGVNCKDRPKLMFDIVCTLTDLQYVVFHATIASHGPYAYQEYYIRDLDGSTLDKEGEREKVLKCLEAAIRRRVSEGTSLELCAKDRVGLLSEVTRVLRESGLAVKRAGVTTVGEQAVNVFYVTDSSGNPVDMKTLEGLREEIGETMMLTVKKAPASVKSPEASSWSKTSFFFGSLMDRFL